MTLDQLRAERSEARKLRYHLNELISHADNRLALPMIGAVLNANNVRLESVVGAPYLTTWIVSLHRD